MCTPTFSIERKDISLRCSRCKLPESLKICLDLSCWFTRNNIQEHSHHPSSMHHDEHKARKQKAFYAFTLVMLGFHAQGHRYNARILIRRDASVSYVCNRNFTIRNNKYFNHKPAILIASGSATEFQRNSSTSCITQQSITNKFMVVVCFVFEWFVQAKQNSLAQTTAWNQTCKNCWEPHSSSSKRFRSGLITSHNQVISLNSFRHILSLKHWGRHMLIKKCPAREASEYRTHWDAHIRSTKWRDTINVYIIKKNHLSIPVIGLRSWSPPNADALAIVMSVVMCSEPSQYWMQSTFLCDGRIAEHTFFDQWSHLIYPNPRKYTLSRQ